jgi:hypothetical protein
MLMPLPPGPAIQIYHRFPSCCRALFHEYQVKLSFLTHTLCIIKANFNILCAASMDAAAAALARRYVHHCCLQLLQLEIHMPTKKIVHR